MGKWDRAGITFSKKLLMRLKGGVKGAESLVQGKKNRYFAKYRGIPKSSSARIFAVLNTSSAKMVISAFLRHHFIDIGTFNGHAHC